MTRSEMVISVMEKRGWVVHMAYPVDPRRKTGEKQTLIQTGNTTIQMTKKHLYIINDVLGDAIYSGLIPPNEHEFIKLLSWLEL